MNSPKIITVTLNPLLDRTLTVHFLAVGYHNRTTDTTHLDPSGHGVNIARVLHQLGHDTHAIVLLGSDANGLAYEGLLREEAFPYTIIQSESITRSRTIIYDTGHNTETQLIEERPEITEVDIQSVADTLKEMLGPDDRVVLAGGLPQSVPLETYVRFIELAHEAGAHVTLSTTVEPLRASLEAHPDLVTLSQHEAEAFFNCPVRTREDVLYCAKRLQKKSGGRVMIEMREWDTALLASDKGQWVIHLPEIEGGTSSGIWDALIAGYLAGRVDHQEYADSLELGATAAGYTAAQVGTATGEREEMQEVVGTVTAQAVQQSDERYLENFEEEA